MKRLAGDTAYRDPDGARFILGQIAEEQKQGPRAIEWYEQIQEGEHALPARPRTANALGYSFAERNTRLREARELIEQALKLAPEDYFIVDSLGWVQYREGDLKGAAETLRRAYGGRPDAEIGAHLGEVLWVMGDRNEANRIWQESLKSAPDNETLQKTIKRLRRRSGRAVAVGRGAVRVPPVGPSLPRARSQAWPAVWRRRLGRQDSAAEH